MDQYLKYIKDNYPFAYDCVKQRLDFGFTIRATKDHFLDRDPKVYSQKNVYPTEKYDRHFHHAENDIVNMRIYDNFFYGEKYYDDEKNKISYYLKTITFVQFLDDMGLEHEKSVEYNEQFNKDNKLQPEEYLYQLMYLVDIHFNKYNIGKLEYNYKNIGLIKWGRKRYYSHCRTDYLIDYEYVNNLINSEKACNEIYEELKNYIGSDHLVFILLSRNKFGSLHGKQYNNNIKMQKYIEEQFKIWQTK